VVLYVEGCPLSVNAGRHELRDLSSPKEILEDMESSARPIASQNGGGAMGTEEKAIQLAERMSKLTAAGKLKWRDAGQLGPWGEQPGRVFKALGEDGTFAQIAEIPDPKSSAVSYYFGVADGSPEIFGLFAEENRADSTDTKLKLLGSLKELYVAARDDARMKKDILRDAEYAYNFDRELYFNRTARKAFSVPFVDDNPKELLARCINENVTENGWRFYFNSEPSESVRHELESVLG
jgi:hypothetical protein